MYYSKIIVIQIDNEVFNTHLFYTQGIYYKIISNMIKSIKNSAKIIFLQPNYKIIFCGIKFGIAIVIITKLYAALSCSKRIKQKSKENLFKIERQYAVALAYF